jgi:transposase
MIQAPKPEPRIMRYELSDFEWTAIKPMLPNKMRGVRRANDRRVLNGATDASLDMTTTLR